MKALKYILSLITVVVIAWSCTDEDFNNIDFLDSGAAPTEVAALFKITQDNSGLVSITPTAEGAVSFNVAFGDGSTSSSSIKAGEIVRHTFKEGTYTVTVIATGITGLITEFKKQIVVSFQPPQFGSEPIVKADASVSKKVNVFVPNDTKYAMFFDAYFVEPGNRGTETIISGNVGDTVSYIYQNTGNVTVKIVLKGGAIATSEYIATDVKVVDILQPVAKAPTPPNRLSSDYFSIFSDKYTNIPGVNVNPDWGQIWQGSSYAPFAVDGDNMLQYIKLSYQGITFEDNPIDVTSMEFIHMDVWTADASRIETSLISKTNGEKPVWRNLTKDQWTSIDIPISEFTSQGLTVADIHQLKLVGDPWAAGTVFVDNIYFYKAPSAIAKLPITFDIAGINTFTPFLGAEFAITDSPTDATNKVGRITNYGDGWGWEGISLKLDQWIDTAIKPVIKMDFYTSTVPHTVLLKLEDTTSPKDGNNNPTVIEEIWVDVTTTGWSELTFNFTSGKKYDNVVLFVDGNQYGITGTYYFDNVRHP